MLRTKNIIISINDVPGTWVFEHFAGLPKLTGQDEAILSMFNAKDTKPSLVFYVKNGEYLFNDFSIGKGGDKCAFYKLYAQHFLSKSLNYSEVCNDLQKLYGQYVLKQDYAKESKITAKPKFKVAGHETRPWFDHDAKYWCPFNISSDILDYFHVKPLKVLHLSNGVDDISIRRGMLYGYFKDPSDIYRTYAPLEEKDRRFNIYGTYIQGSDQLTYDKSFLTICSSLKDCMSLFSLNYDTDVVAPSSENSYLTKKEIDFFKSKYQKVQLLFDYDDPGKKAADIYKTRYDLDIIELPLSKDLSDSIRDFGVNKVTEHLTKHFS